MRKERSSNNPAPPRPAGVSNEWHWIRLLHGTGAGHWLWLGTSSTISGLSLVPPTNPPPWISNATCAAKETACGHIRQGHLFSAGSAYVAKETACGQIRQGCVISSVRNQQLNIRNQRDGL